MVTEFDPGLSRVEITTREDFDWFLRSTRTVAPLDDGSSVRFTYRLEADIDMLSQISPMLPPDGFIEWMYRRRASGTYRTPNA